MQFGTQKGVLRVQLGTQKGVQRSFPLLFVFLLHTGMLPASGPQAIISCSPPGDTRGLVSVSISVAQACPKLPAILDMYA